MKLQKYAGDMFMALYSENVVFSRYRNEQALYFKAIQFNTGKNQYVKNVTFHNEHITNIECNIKSKMVEIKITFEIFFVYSMIEDGVINSYSYSLKDTQNTYADIGMFNPHPLKSDLYNSKVKAYVRKLKADFDIDLNGKTITISITGILITNFFKERCIMLKDENENKINEILGQVAVSSDIPKKDIKSCMLYLNNSVEFISKYIEITEKENLDLKSEMKIIESEDEKLKRQYEEQKAQSESLSKECSRLLIKLKEMEEKYVKEQKKTGILEVESNRNLDEIKSLKKQNLELSAKSLHEPISFKEKIKKFLE